MEMKGRFLCGLKELLSSRLYTYRKMRTLKRTFLKTETKKNHFRCQFSENGNAGHATTSTC